MIHTLDWLKDNPSVAGGLMSAVIAAAVALVVFAITQILTGKRNRAQLLVPKLEELYLRVNKLAAENATVCVEAFLAIDGDKDALARIQNMDHLELYGHRTAKEIIMYIRLYFPDLGHIHQLLFAAQRELNNRLFEISIGQLPAMSVMLDCAGKMSHFIRLLEEEIISNRDALIRDRLWSRTYRHTREETLRNVTPPPTVPLWTKQAEEPPERT